MILARAAGLDIHAHHVDHGHRPGTAAAAHDARQIADRLGIACTVHRVEMRDGPSFEAAAREARRRVLPPSSMTGHTADDLAETVLFRLLRGTGPDGLAAMRLGPTHPLLGLRRSDTIAVCERAGITPLDDPTNADSRFTRNRIRNELLPLAAEVMGRDPVPMLARTARLAAEHRDLIDEWSTQIDPTDATAIAGAPVALARQAIRRWIGDRLPNRYPPDHDAVERVLDVACGRAVACEIGGGIRVERSRQRLRIVEHQR